jgi:hypothetical protein
MMGKADERSCAWRVADGGHVQDWDETAVMVIYAENVAASSVQPVDVAIVFDEQVYVDNQPPTLESSPLESSHTVFLPHFGPLAR